MNISICNGELSILSMQSSTRDATAYFDFFSNLYWFYLCLYVRSKQVGFFGCAYCFEKTTLDSLVSDAISPRSLLTKNEVLIHVDYNESYENKQQLEIQRVYFGHTRFSIFTACCYLHDGVTIVLYSTGPSSFLNCFQVLIHF